MYIALFFLSYHGKCYPAEISWNISAFSRYSLLQGSVLNGLNAQGTPYKIMRNVKKRKKFLLNNVWCKTKNAHGKCALFLLFLHYFFTLTAILCIWPEVLHLYFDILQYTVLIKNMFRPCLTLNQWLLLSFYKRNMTIIELKTLTIRTSSTFEVMKKHRRSWIRIIQTM